MADIAQIVRQVLEAGDDDLDMKDLERSPEEERQLAQLHAWNPYVYNPAHYGDVHGYVNFIVPVFTRTGRLSKTNSWVGYHRFKLDAEGHMPPWEQVVDKLNDLVPNKLPGFYPSKLQARGYVVGKPYSLDQRRFVEALEEANDATLYHLTWDLRVPGIMENGLLPNEEPNKWAVADANERAKQGIFLCNRSRLDYWRMTYEDGWVEPPTPEARLVALSVRVPRAWLRADSAPGENYAGDFICRRPIPPECIGQVEGLEEARVLTLLHGTSSALLEKASAGLQSPFLTDSRQTALYYAQEAVDEAGGDPVVLQVRVRELTRLLPDLPSFEEPLDFVYKQYAVGEEEFHKLLNDPDSGISWPENDHDWQTSLRVVGSVRYDGVLTDFNLLEEADDLDMKDLDLPEWEVDQAAATEVAERLNRAGLRFTLTDDLRQRAENMPEVAEAVRLGPDAEFLLDRRLKDVNTGQERIRMWTVVPYTPDYGDYYTVWKFYLQDVVGKEHQLWLHNRGLIEVNINVNKNTLREMIERLALRIEEAKPVDRERLEKVYNKLYGHAERVLKQHCPCGVSKEGGCVSCVGSRAGITPSNELCCTGCEHHSTKAGCQAEKPMACKTWLCPPASETSPEASAKLGKIARQAKAEGARPLYEDGQWQVLEIITRQAAQIYGAGTKWCVTYRETDKFWLIHSDPALHSRLVYILGKLDQRKFCVAFSDAGSEHRDAANDEIGEEGVVAETGFTDEFLRSLLTAPQVEALLDETGNSEPYPVERTGSRSSQGFLFAPSWSFQAGDEEYVIGLDRKENGVAEYGFTFANSRQRKPAEPSGPGGVFRIYCTVMHTIADSVAHEQPKVVLMHNQDQRRANVVSKFLSLFPANYARLQEGSIIVLYRTDAEGAEALARQVMAETAAKHVHESDDLDMKDLDPYPDAHIERWVFTAHDLQHPDDCRANDELIAHLGSDEEGPVAEQGVIVKRNGQVTDRWEDGTQGVSEEYAKLAEESEELTKPYGEGDLDVAYADTWRDVWVDDHGFFVAWVKPERIGESLEDEGADPKDLEGDAVKSYACWYHRRGTARLFRFVVANCPSPEEAMKRFQAFDFGDGRKRTLVEIKPMDPSLEESLEDEGADPKELDPNVPLQRPASGPICVIRAMVDGQPLYFGATGWMQYPQQALHYTRPRAESLVRAWAAGGVLGDWAIDVVVDDAYRSEALEDEGVDMKSLDWPFIHMIRARNPAYDFVYYSPNSWVLDADSAKMFTASDAQAKAAELARLDDEQLKAVFGAWNLPQPGSIEAVKADPWTQHKLGYAPEALEDEGVDMKSLDSEEVQPSDWVIKGYTRRGGDLRYFTGRGWTPHLEQALHLTHEGALARMDAIGYSYRHGPDWRAVARHIGRRTEAVIEAVLGEDNDFDMKDLEGPPVPRGEVEFLLWCEPEEDISFKREFAHEPKVVRWIQRQLDNGNEWGWCQAHVIAKWTAPDGNEYTGDAYLGGCSYRSEKDFKAKGGYYPQMCDDAYKDLVEKFQQGLAESRKEESVDDELGMKELDPAPPPPPPVEANIMSDDGELSVDFNAVPWLETATPDEIAELKQCGWGGDYPADKVAEALAASHEALDSFFGAVTGGFEVHVDELQAKRYLQQYRPDVWQQVNTVPVTA